MLGISLGKILFTVLVVVVVWWVFKTIQRRHAAMSDQSPRPRAHERAANAAREAVRATMEKRGQDAVVEDLEKCPKCGTYKPRGAACQCEKEPAADQRG